MAGFLKTYTFHIMHLRENMKTISQKHAMRGTAALLAHVVNDYLVKELPHVRDMMYEGADEDVEIARFMWEIDGRFRNYGNVKVVEYEDDNEYFNIDPDADVRFADGTNPRYWEQLAGMSYEDRLGVFTRK